MAKRKARERVIEAEYGESLETARIAAKSDAELFVLDNAASIGPKKAARRLKAAKRKVTTESKTEAVLVSRMLAKIGRRSLRGIPAPTEDLWADEPSQTQARASTVGALGGVATGGQSYNPSLDEHQAVIKEAVAVESKKQARSDASKAWWAARAQAREASDDEDDQVEEEKEEEDADESRPLSTKRPEPRTRTQRNKSRRKRAADLELEKREALKAQRRDIDAVKQIRRDLDQAETDRDAKRAAVAAVKAANPVRPEPAAPPAVALSDELVESGGTLRRATALRGPAALLRAFKDGDAVAKHKNPALRKKKQPGLIERKKPPRRKFRGAKVLARYRKAWIE